MAEPFLSEIRLFSFNFAPKGWAQCNGQLLPINQNQALFSLLGTTYGGNGQTTFALPDQRGRAALHMGPNYTLGQRAGEESHTVSLLEMPAHTHALNGTSEPGTEKLPGNNLLAKNAPANAWAPASAGSLQAMHASTVGTVGGSQPHENRQPFLAVNFCIALQGIFPSQN
jgi:microcystin-dependent protein